jgi:DNA-binding IclR family transcriptional regulator
VAHDPLAERLAPVLADLRDATGETVIFGKRVEDRAVYLDVLEGPHTVRYAARIGDFKPLHSSAVGKALLGRLELARVTPATITRRRALAAGLAAGRARGWYVKRARTSLVAARQTLEAAG